MAYHGAHSLVMMRSVENNPAYWAIFAAFPLSWERFRLIIQLITAPDAIPAAMLAKLFQSDTVGLAFLCHTKALLLYGSLVLWHATLLRRHPQAHPQQQTLPENPCALYRNLLVRLFNLTLRTVCFTL
jgi:hypothetical protein